MYLELQGFLRHENLVADQLTVGGSYGQLCCSYLMLLMMLPCAVPTIYQKEKRIPQLDLSLLRINPKIPLASLYHYLLCLYSKIRKFHRHAYIYLFPTSKRFAKKIVILQIHLHHYLSIYSCGVSTELRIEIPFAGQLRLYGSSADTPTC